MSFSASKQTRFLVLSSITSLALCAARIPACGLQLRSCWRLDEWTNEWLHDKQTNRGWWTTVEERPWQMDGPGAWNSISTMLISGDIVCVSVCVADSERMELKDKCEESWQREGGLMSNEGKRQKKINKAKTEKNKETSLKNLSLFLKLLPIPLSSAQTRRTPLCGGVRMLSKDRCTIFHALNWSHNALRKVYTR